MDIDRRDLFRMAAAAMAGGAVMESEADAQKKLEIPETQSEQNINMVIDFAYQSKYDDLNFSVEKKEITEKIETLIREINRYSQRLNSANHPSEIPPIKLDLWRAFKGYFPNLPEEFSEKEYYEIIFIKLPRELVQYGILLNPSTAFVAPPPSKTILAAEGKIFMCKITRVEQNTTDIDGKNISVPTVHLDNYEIDGRSVNTSDPTAPTEAHAKSILVYDQALEAHKRGSVNVVIEKMKQQLERVTDQQIWAKLESTPAGAQQDTLAIQASYMRTFREFIKTGIKPDFLDRSSMAHETGHLITDTLPNWVEDNRPHKGIKTMRDFNTWRFKHLTHSETGAHLYAFLASDNPFADMMQIYQGTKAGSQKFETENGRYFSQYEEASKRILHAMAAEIIANHKEYGITLDSNSSVDIKNQALYHLVDVIKDKVKIKKLVKILIEKFKKDRDLESRISYDNLIAPSTDDKIGTSSITYEEESGCSTSISIAFLTATAAALGIGGLIHRRMKLAKERLLKEKEMATKRKRKKKKKYSN